MGYYYASAAAVASYLLSENFEGTGIPAGWTATTVNWDYTTSPLEGAQSMTPSSVTDYGAYVLSADQATLDVYFQMRVDVISTNSWQKFFRLLDSGAAEIMYAELQQAGTGIYVNGVSATTISFATNYHVWVHHVAGSRIDFYISTTDTKPGSPTYSKTTGVSANSVHAIRFYGSSPTSNFIFDKVRASASVIGSSPT